MAPEEIKSLRKMFKMTRKAFGELMGGVSDETIRRWEIGERKPLPAFQRKLDALAKEVGA